MTVFRAAVLGALYVCQAIAAFELIHERESQYNYIRVTQVGSERTLEFRRSGSTYRESAVDVTDPLRLVLPYSEKMFAGFVFAPEPKEMLMVGLGAGVCPRVMTHYFPGLTCDVIELDPAVVEVAEEHFGFQQSPSIRVIVRDGRVGVKVLARQKKKYDIIMLDAFRAGYIPYHLTTKEFLEQCKALLNPGGILVSNLWPSLLLYEYERRTMATVFAEQVAFGRWGNRIVVCLQDKQGLTQQTLRSRALEISRQRSLAFDLPAVIDQMMPQPDYTETGDILTDDYAPANVLNSIPRD